MKPNNPPLLAIHQALLYYRPSHAVLHGVDIRLQAQERVAIVGPSGAGKSSIAKLLINPAAIHPSRDNTAKRRRRLLRTAEYIAFGQVSADPSIRSGIIFQNSRATLNPFMVVDMQLRDTIRYSNNASPADVDSKLRLLWKSVALPEELLGQKIFPHQYSEGMCQRAAIAMVLATTPHVVIADEPTKSLDAHNQKNIAQLLVATSTEYGNALVLITHNLLLAHTICQRIIVIEKGTVVDSYKVTESAPSMKNRALITRRLWQALTPTAAPMSSSTPPSAPPSTSALLVLKDVWYRHSYSRYSRYSRRKLATPVLKGIDLTIPVGACVGIQGESGAGKSTLLAVIARLTHIERGRITLGGKDMHALNKRESHQARRDVQIIFQDPLSSFNPAMSVLDIITEPLRIHGPRHAGSRTKWVKSAWDVMLQVGLALKYSNWYPHQLSGGEQQRVLIARALIQRPALILADEPLSTLDGIHQEGIVALFLQLQKTLHISLLIVSHHIERLAAICNARYLLKDGALHPID